jgi:hypothetical protein
LESFRRLQARRDDDLAAQLLDSPVGLIRRAFNRWPASLSPSNTPENDPQQSGNTDRICEQQAFDTQAKLSSETEKLRFIGPRIAFPFRC